MTSVRGVTATPLVFGPAEAPSSSGPVGFDQEIAAAIPAGRGADEQHGEGDAGDAPADGVAPTADADADPPADAAAEELPPTLDGALLLDAALLLAGFESPAPLPGVAVDMPVVPPSLARTSESGEQPVERTPPPGSPERPAIPGALAPTLAPRSVGIAGAGVSGFDVHPAAAPALASMARPSSASPTASPPRPARTSGGPSALPPAAPLAPPAAAAAPVPLSGSGPSNPVVLPPVAPMSAPGVLAPPVGDTSGAAPTFPLPLERRPVETPAGMDPLQTVKSPVSGVEPGPALAARAGRTGSWTGSGVVALGEGDGGVASVRVAEPAGILDSWGSGPGPDTWAPVRAVLTTLAPLLRPAARGERPIEEALAPAGPPASTSSSEEPAAEAGDRVHRPAPSGPVPAAAAGTATPVRPAQGAEGEPPAPPDSPMGRDGTLGPEPAAPAGEAPETAGVEGREPAARATGFGLSVGERARAPATPVAASMAPVHAAASGNDELSLMLPRHLRLEVADAGGSWTLEIHDHGRALDVLVRGHGSMGAIVAAAAPELRTALAQDGHTLGLLDFVAADGGDPRERAGRQEQGEPGEGRASPRETTPGGPAPGARTFRPGRIHRVA